MLDQLKDAKAFAQELQHLAGRGEFDPFSLLSGTFTCHSCFLAPLSPQFVAARDDFLANGVGPLSSLPKQFEESGLSPEAARQQAKSVLESSRCMLVIVLRNDHGLQCMPQLSSGAGDEAFRAGAISALKEREVSDEGVQEALQILSDRIHLAGENMHHCWAACEDEEVAVGLPSFDDTTVYWENLGSDLFIGLEEALFSRLQSGQIECAGWVCAALLRCAQDSELDGEQLFILARCAAQADSLAVALGATRSLAEQYEVDEEDAYHIISDCVAAAIRTRQADQGVVLFDQNFFSSDLIEGSYEVALLELHIRLAAMQDFAQLQFVCERLKKLDKRSLLNDLHRERIWEVALDDVGEVLTTSEAADFLDRSVDFVSRRLDVGTIPFHRHEKELRVPKQALKTWKQLIDAYAPIDA